MQFEIKSGHADKLTASRRSFPGTAELPQPFGLLTVTAERDGDRHPPALSLFFGRPEDLDSLIREATALRAELATAPPYRAVCEACGAVGTEDSPLTLAGTTEDGRVYLCQHGCPAAQEPPAGPAEAHAEDAHADAAPVG